VGAAGVDAQVVSIQHPDRFARLVEFMAAKSKRQKPPAGDVLKAAPEE